MYESLTMSISFFANIIRMSSLKVWLGNPSNLYKVAHLQHIRRDVQTTVTTLLHKASRIRTSYMHH